MLRLYDHRTGRAEAPPGGRGLRVQIMDGAGHRALVVADLLRRVARRTGRTVRVVAPPAAGGDLTEYNVAPFEVLGEPLPDADVYVSPEDGAGRADGAALRMTVPRETGGWTPADALSARLAMLEVPYREPLERSPERLAQAAGRLDGWRGKVAEWATAPGRPLNREYARDAEAALADDLDSPGALAVLDRLAADADVPPGAKLETFIHLDLLLALGLVAAIGSA